MHYLLVGDHVVNATGQFVERLDLGRNESYCRTVGLKL